VKITAVGGTQTVRVMVESSYFGYNDFDRPFEAEIPGSTFSVESLAPPTVTLRALQTGSGILRIVDPDSDELFDLIDIDAQPIHRATISLPDPGFISLFECSNSLILYQGAAIELTARIFSQANIRLVDDSMSITVLDAAETGSGTQVAWDRLQFAGSGDATNLRVQLTAGDGGTYLADMPLANAVDDIEPLNDAIDPMSPGSTGYACFWGIFDGDCVVGLPWSFTVTGAGSYVDTLYEGVTELGCITFQADTLGVIDIQATALGVTHQLQIPVVLQPHTPPDNEPPASASASASPSPSPFAQLRPNAPAPGFRAARMP